MQLTQQQRNELIECARIWIAEAERLRDEIPFGLAEDADNELTLIRIALAALMAEPVGNFYEDGPGNWWQIGPHDKVPQVTPLFDRPAPAVDLAELVPAMPSLNNGIVGYNEGWNSCRATILRNIEGAHQNRQQNIPEIIPGWKLVPIEKPVTDDKLLCDNIENNGGNLCRAEILRSIAEAQRLNANTRS